MTIKVKQLFIFTLFTWTLILITACASAKATPVVPEKQTTEQSTSAIAQSSASQPIAQTDPKRDTNATVAKPKTASVNRVDVIYFHVNQRCVTCLCFEEHVNNVINKYFNDAIKSGKLTYQVLNAQLPQNDEIAKKYQVVGSQLFINTITNGVDSIEDISKIWEWNCRNNPQGFELKVKNAIEARLKVQG